MIMRWIFIVVRSDHTYHLLHALFKSLFLHSYSPHPPSTIPPIIASVRARGVVGLEESVVVGGGADRIEYVIINFTHAL